ncbi:cyclin-dependent kinase regulatory subunit [Elsinoe australis]|uniref:Cyclin-dependent kinase regulatory subunit n=1 Tax=Elsinoe australis TaxID=40998 RepID=A0A2P7Z3E6_9PEZI|nr:cyclin-dependent kinase regulatory subunit [Elsinoe australis]
MNDFGPELTPVAESDPFVAVHSTGTTDASVTPSQEEYHDAPDGGAIRGQEQDVIQRVAEPVADPEKAALADDTPDPRLGGHNKESVELPEFLRRSHYSSSSSTSGEYTDAIRPAPSNNASRQSVNRTGPGQHTLSAKSSSRSLPSLRRRETRLAQKEAHPWQHLGITLGMPMILLFDLVVPCIVYYTWYNKSVAQWERDCFDRFRDQQCPLEKPETDRKILGAAVACFGFGEIWILAARVWRLFFRREECAPLLSKNRWELDATSWVYLVAVLMALMPFVIGSELLIPKLYLYGPSFIMVFLGSLMIISIIAPFNLPVKINSQPKGTPMRPFIYYAAEDFIAVDGLQDREFRIRYNERYEGNKRFRRFFTFLTLFWILGVCLYEGAVSAIIWNLPFHYAFGSSLGVLFGWIATWALCTYAIVEWEMKRENTAYEAGEFIA